MGKEELQRLTKSGLIVSKGAAERVTEKEVDRILSMRHPPMYINEQFLEWMRGRNPDVGYTTIEATRNIKSFTGVDGKVYYLTWSEERRVPQANADLMVNRGMADRAT